MNSKRKYIVSKWNKKVCIKSGWKSPEGYDCKCGGPCGDCPGPEELRHQTWRDWRNE